MTLADMILPAPKAVSEQRGIVCQLAKLNWIESEGPFPFAVAAINEALAHVGLPPLPYSPSKMNLGTRQRVSLGVSPALGPEAYRLAVGNETITIAGGDAAGVLYGARSLAQAIVVSAEFGGHDRYIPVGVVEDAPRFPYRGVLLDSSRHFQHVGTILKLIDEMSRLKLNRLHWHLVDRQGWRLPLACAPELVRDMPRSRCYSFGAYTPDDIRAVRTYAAERAVAIVPEIEMPGHSAAVFLTHPELACDTGADPFENDFWEFCIGNPKVRDFLSAVLAETASLFPDSPIIHIGGDEAGTAHWEKCRVCQGALREKGLADFRALERDFMRAMEEVVAGFGRRAMTWGLTSDDGAHFSSGMVIQNWLREDVSAYVAAGHAVVNSYHRACYFDYPTGDDEPPEEWQRRLYDFDAAAGAGDRPDLVLGGEGCIWTEQLPEWRVLPRARPRLRALAETLWSPADRKDFDGFRLRERRLVGAGLFL